MKAFLGASFAAAAAFVFMGLQTGLFGERIAADEEKIEAAPEKKPAPVRARFPEDLAPAARAKPVAAAADFKVGDTIHKLAFLKVNGALHPWHQKSIDYNEEWTANYVEEAELVLVVGEQSKTMIDRAHFVNGPPIDRNRWEVEVSVVEAKTGKVLANRKFVNMPRAIRPQEAYEVTALGQPVQYLTVFGWVANQSKFGFSHTINAAPLVTVVEKQ